MNKTSGEEKKRHSTLLVPYSYYNCKIPEYFEYVPLHWHNEFEINYILEGRGNFRCGDNLFLADKGDMIIIPPDTPHSIMQRENEIFHYDTLVFSKSLLSDPSGSRISVELLCPLTEGRLKFPIRITEDNCRYGEMKTSLKNIMLCAKEDNARYDLLMKSELLKLIWLLLETGEIRGSVSESAKYSKEIQNAVNFISHHFSENITIEQLALLTHLSKSCFMGKFKREVGQSAVTYLNCIRIKNACEILISTDKSTAAAAFECGFRNISNFNRQFLRYVGCSPTEYKKTVRIHLHDSLF